MQLRPLRYLATCAVIGIPLVATVGCELPVPRRAERQPPRVPISAHALPDSVAVFCRHLGWLDSCQIWEVTDDQRLNDGNDRYGPYSFLLVSNRLASLRMADFQSPANSGQVVAAVHVDAPGGSALPSTYQELHLVPGRNCVYLGWSREERGPRWRAYVAPGTPSDNPCPPRSDLSNPLQVHPVSHARFSRHAHVPPVVRFHEGRDRVRNRPQPFLGVKCGDAWCMILPEHTDTIPLPHAGRHPDRVTWEVHGWGDTQRLATASGGQLKLSKYWASVLPVEGLSRLILDDFKSSRRRVATVYFPDLPKPLGLNWGVMYARHEASKYTGGWGFSVGENHLSLGAAQQTVLAPSETGSIVVIDPRVGWHAQTERNFGRRVSARGARPSLDHPVIARDHGKTMIGTARFAWSEQDEDVWISCDRGCCKISGT